MRSIRHFIVFTVVLLICLSILLHTTIPSEYPELRSGDLIFQTSTSNQSGAIFVATANAYTHMGIIKKNGSNIVVIEAVGTVRETPLKDWVNRALFKRVAIYRDPTLTPSQAKQILAKAKTYYGRAYDIFFSFNNNAMYCSELPYLAYKGAGIPIGKVQKVSELNFDNWLVKKLIKARWQRHEECKSEAYDFEKCFQHILNQDLITPASIARDSRFEKIYSNYPL
jgi:hypothetical protein